MVIATMLGARPASTDRGLRVSFWLMVNRLGQGHHWVLLGVLHKSLAECDDEVPSTCHRCDSSGIEMLHQLWCSLCIVVSCTQLSGIVLAPTVDIARLGECKTKAVADRNL